MVLIDRRMLLCAGCIVLVSLFCSSCAGNDGMIRNIPGPDTAVKSGTKAGAKAKTESETEKESTSKYFELPETQPEYPLRRPPSMGTPE